MSLQLQQQPRTGCLITTPTPHLLLRRRAQPFTSCSHNKNIPEGLHPFPSANYFIIVGAGVGAREANRQMTGPSQGVQRLSRKRTLG